MKLTNQDFDAIRRWMHRNARPLDLARWQYHFESGSAEAVLQSLSAYQNEDGLEADCWNPASAPMQTWAAACILRELNAPKEHPIVAGILRYLGSGAHFVDGLWQGAIPSNNDFPHAPWWTFTERSGEDWGYNPTASLAGFVLQYGVSESALYKKAEGIATKILSLVIFYAGVQMLLSSTKNIFSDEVKEIPSAIAIYVTIFSIIGKLLLASYQYKQGKKINSSMLTANAINMRNDVVISTSVLLGLIFTFIFKLPILDSITGLIISLFIIKSSISIFIDSNVELMDGVKDVNVYNKIFEAVEKVPGASNPHRVRSRMIGNLYMITLDIEVNPQITITQAHEIADAVEKSIINSVDNVYDILVHVEPAGKCQTGEKFGVDKDMV